MNHLGETMITERSRLALDVGASIITMFLKQRLSWTQAFSEFADNSFGFNCRKLLFRFHDGNIDIVDDGDGCDDLWKMQSFCRSEKVSGNKASMFGVGGKMGQIKLSNAGEVEVVTRTANRKGRFRINWGFCLERDNLLPEELHEQDMPFTARTGTTISIKKCRKFKDSDKATTLRDLGYRYKGMLLEGRSIAIEVEGIKHPVKPYQHPPFVREIKIDIWIEGHHITGFCGIVQPGHPNPFPGWSIHWGYRFIGQFNEPAEGRPANRIYAEIYLPESWDNIGPTKDSWDYDPDSLWEALAETCREAVEAAEEQVQEVELTSTTRAAEDILGKALGSKKGVKGARPGDAGKNGTANPTGDGPEHKKFAKSQPGEKPDDDEMVAVNTPDRVRIAWDETIESLYDIQTTKGKDRAFILTLNPSVRQVAEFKGHPSLLATYCLGFVAREITEKDHVAKMFKFSDMEFKDVYKKLLDRIIQAESPNATA